MPQDFGDTQQAQFEADLQRARGYKPVTSEDLTKAYKQYDLTTGGVHKNDTDTQLYDKAKTTVLAWWARQKNQPADATDTTPPPPFEETPWDPVGGYGGGSGGSGGYGSNDPSLTGKPEASTSAGAREGGGQAHAAPPPPQVDPNTYAKIRESGPLPPKAPAQMTNAQVQVVMGSVKGLPPSLSASSIPAEYRTSQASLTSYLNMKAKEYQVAVQKALQDKMAQARAAEAAAARAAAAKAAAAARAAATKRAAQVKKKK